MPIVPPAAGAGSGAAPRALVIDDSELARSFVSGLLNAAGFDVFTLASAIGATRAIVQNRISVVVVDVSMPGLNGDKLVGVLRANSRLSNLVIIVISAKPAQELEQIAADTEADAVLNKDELDQRLVPLIRNLLRARPPVRDPGAAQ